MTESTGNIAAPADSQIDAEADASVAAPSTEDAADAVVVTEAETAKVTARPGIPVWRVGKPDAFLAADVATARNAVLSIAKPSDIGRHLGVRSEGVRCATHLFESTKPGYQGWAWFASLARVSRGKASTVNEVGMLPTEDSVLAPAWVPWAQRVRPEDQEEAASPLHATDDGAADANSAEGTVANEEHSESADGSASHASDVDHHDDEDDSAQEN